MDFIVNSSYIIIFEIGGKCLTYHCKIIENNDISIKFEDKFGKIFEYRKDKIVSVEELGE